MDQLRTCEHWWCSEMAGEVLAAAQWDQAHLRLRITGGRGRAPRQQPVLQCLCGTLPSAIWERSREKLSKTVRGSDRLWLALIERNLVIFGEGKHVENALRAWCCSVGATQTLLKEELRRDSRLGRDPVLACAYAHIGFANKELRGIQSH